MTRERIRIIGQKITAIETAGVTDKVGKRVKDLVRIRLANGAVLVPSVVELGDDYAVTLTAYKPRKVS